MNNGVAFPKDPAAQAQFFRMMTPDTGSFDVGVITDSMSQLFAKTGGGVFVTHSAGGYTIRLPLYYFQYHIRSRMI